MGLPTYKGVQKGTQKCTNEDFSSRIGGRDLLSPTNDLVHLEVSCLFWSPIVIKRSMVVQ